MGFQIGTFCGKLSNRSEIHNNRDSILAPRHQNVLLKISPLQIEDAMLMFDKQTNRHRYVRRTSLM